MILLDVVVDCILSADTSLVLFSHLRGDCSVICVIVWHVSVNYNTILYFFLCVNARLNDNIKIKKLEP